MSLWQDIRYAARRLTRDWPFTLAVTGILALCIGANAAMFSIFHSVLMRPLPYPEPDRLLQVVTEFEAEDGGWVNESQNGLVWEAIRDSAPSLEATVFSNWTSGVNLAVNDSGRYVRQQRVSASFFRVLGVSPFIGRSFTQEEDREGGPQAVILSHGMWERDFGSDPSVVGTPVLLRGEPHTIVGIMPPSFESSVIAELWTPIRPSTRGEGSGANYAIVARLRPTVSAAQARAEVASLSASVIEAGGLPSEPAATLNLLKLQRAETNQLDDPLSLLAAASSALLLLGCINIGGMLLARSAQRRSEIATRLALGAGQGRIIRQLLVESVLLAALGGAAALALSGVLISSLQSIAASVYPQLLSVTLQWPALAATLGLTLVCGVFFGLIPALQVSRVDLRSAQSGSRTVAGQRRFIPMGLMAGLQVALMIPLLLGSGLLMRTFQHLWDLDPGFDSSNVVAARFSLQDARYATAADVQNLAARTLPVLESQPGIEAAAMSLSLPYERGLNMPFMLPGKEGFDRAITNMSYVSPGFFDVLRIPLLRGRTFDARDTANSSPVVIVNDAFARRYLVDQPALGEPLEVASVSFEIIGIVGSVQQRPGWGNFGPLAPIPTVYVIPGQMGDGFVSTIHTWFSPAWLVRSSLPVRDLTASIENATRLADPMLPLADVSTLGETKATSLSLQRLMALLLSVAGGLALLLAALGIYGLTSNLVTERWKELGIRQALGSTRSATIRSVLRPTLSWVGLGVGAGCVLALSMEQLLASFVFGVSGTDPMTLGTVAVGLVAMTGVASLLPALAVVQLDPATVLRSE